jgi:uncharacterized membrane protein
MRSKVVVSGGGYVGSLVLATVVSGGLLLGDSLLYHDLVPTYMLWNLFLAWVPFGLACWLMRILDRKRWSSWEGLLVSVAWLAFLPNSFYMITDFIHLAEVSDPNQLLYSAIMFASFIYTGVVLGLSSLYMVHAALRRRFSGHAAIATVGAVLLVCSLAIYVGRDLRWNTWDLLVDPAGVLFDLSTRLLHPAQYGSVLVVVIPFFILLSTLYTVIWQTSELFVTSGPFRLPDIQPHKHTKI